MIAIKDMPMPKNCYECWFEDANQCYLNILQHIESLDRPEWCPLVEVAEPIKHGRWINADELKEEIARRDSTDGFVKVYSGREVNEIIDLLTVGARKDEVEK